MISPVIFAGALTIFAGALPPWAPPGDGAGSPVKDRRSTTVPRSQPAENVVLKRNVKLQLTNHFSRTLTDR